MPNLLAARAGAMRKRCTTRSWTTPPRSTATGTRSWWPTCRWWTRNPRWSTPSRRPSRGRLRTTTRASAPLSAGPWPRTPTVAASTSPRSSRWRASASTSRTTACPSSRPRTRRAARSGSSSATTPKNRGFDQQTANQLNAKGVTTVIGWAGEWVLWGPHTAAYDADNPSVDPRSFFATNMRTLFHITNSFQLEWSPLIDQPMTARCATASSTESKRSWTSWSPLARSSVRRASSSSPRRTPIPRSCAAISAGTSTRPRRPPAQERDGLRPLHRRGLLRLHRGE